MGQKIKVVNSVIKRICILSECAWPDIGGGVTQAHSLAKYLKNNGCSVFFLTQTKGLKLKRKEVIDSIPIHRVFSTGFRSGKYTMLLPALCFLIKNRREYDLIYVAGFRVLGVIGVITAKLLCKKCILKAESLGEFSGEIFKWDSKVLKKGVFSKISDFVFYLRNYVLKKADAFVAINEIIKREFIDNGVPVNKVRYIPNGIDRFEFCPVLKEEKNKLREKLHLPLDKKIAIYTGRLNKGKGLPMLFSVWHKLVTVKKDILLVIAGSGSNQFLSIEQELKRFVDDNALKENVLFTGYVDNVDEYLNACDVFVLPSELEGLSCSIMEALACGISVVTTNVGGAPELIESGKNGILIQPEIHDELYKALYELINGIVNLNVYLPERFYMDEVLKSYNQLLNDLYLQNKH